jgi:glycosyltransferase involved in cell wall biosynthesis
VMVDNGIAAEKIKTIPNGYDPREHAQLPDKDAARSILNLTADEKIIAYTGQIRPDKGVDALLDTAQVCPETTMLIVGGSVSEVAELQKMAAQRQLSNIRLVSQVPIREVPTYLAAADILILPPSSLPLKSATVLPMKTFTYMAAGKPIVAPEQPDTRGVLIHERNCLTVPPDMPSATAVAIRSILSSPSLARELSNNARQDATQYTWDGRAAKVIAFVKEKLARS